MGNKVKLITVSRKIRDFYCYADFFLNRGLGIFNGLYQVMKYAAFTGIIVGMVNEVLRNMGFDFQVAMESVFLLTPAFIVLLIFLGILDVKKLKVLQKTNEISTRYNPFLVDLIKNGYKKNKNYDRKTTSRRIRQEIQR